MKIDKEPRYLSDEEAAEFGFFPDADGSTEPEVYGPTPGIKLGHPFEPKPIPLNVNGEIVELPQIPRRTVTIYEQNKDGEIYQRPAKPIEVGGLEKIDPQNIHQDVDRDFHKTFLKSSRKIINNS